MAGKKRKKKNSISNFLGMAAIASVVVVLLVVLSSRTASLREKDAAYAAMEERLNHEYEQLQERAEELEEQRIYVQPRQFVEEMAKDRLGLVKPGEMILKPAN